MSAIKSDASCLIELSIKLKTPDPFSGVLKDTANAEFQLLKADGGFVGEVNEEWFSITVEPGKRPDLSDARINVNAHARYNVQQTKTKNDGN